MHDMPWLHFSKKKQNKQKPKKKIGNNLYHLLTQFEAWNPAVPINSFLSIDLSEKDLGTRKLIRQLGHLL